MKNVLIASFDMEVGGVERSLISMLDNFDYEKYTVDLMLYRHQGDFMTLISDRVNIIGEVPEYTTFRKSIGKTLSEKYFGIGLSRILSKLYANLKGRFKGIAEPGYYQLQLMWKFALPFLPNMQKEYDVAISYLWPHYFIAEKVKAKTKIAWIHTDYSTVYTDVNIDIKVWKKFDYIVSISNDCTSAFLSKYPELREKIVLIENITSPAFIKKMAEEKVDDILIGNNHFNIVSVGRLSYQKAFDNAIKALRILHNRGLTNLKWYVVGYGGEEKKLNELIKENNLEDSFILLGKKINPYPYIKLSDLYVQPSRYEGKAVTVREAQILSKPVLITNYATAKSQVDDGVDGYITELSVEGIVNGIENLYNSSATRKKLIGNCSLANYGNSYELDKLYKVI
ncbi:glycosyltransferase [Metabacillus halosaccharovorans]|uniref:glycosyltransferase n=1 Tax=Metabacillus halosaccharovorans TaxID=930124 RepID=UPI0034CD1AC7